MANLNSSDYDFDKGDELSDMKLIVEDKTIHVHRAILANVSPVFKRMFISDFKETRESEVKLPGKKYDDICEMLNIIYPSKSKEFDEGKLETLLQLSEEYNIVRITNLIEKRLIKKLTDGSSSTTKQPSSSLNVVVKNLNKKLYGKQIETQLEYTISLLQLSNVYRLKKLRVECIHYIANCFRHSLIEKFINLNEDIDYDDRFEILRKKLEIYEEKLEKKDERLKKLEDENMIQKFEIQRLSLLVASTNGNTVEMSN